MSRPAWVPEDLYPFESRHAEVDGSRVHYVDEGGGPPLLLLHGNPTWSFLYREIVLGLRDRFRCIALDLPGFGLSTAAPGYGFTPAEHADVVERFVLTLDLNDAAMMVQDWGGPIGFAVATRHPDRFSGFVVGNTWAFKAGYNYGETSEDFIVSYEVRPAKLAPGVYRNITGNEALSLGLVAASIQSGLDLFLGAYPITPASGILEELGGMRLI